MGEAYFPCTFTVLENDDVDFLLGLDMLKRHQVREAPWVDDFDFGPSRYLLGLSAPSFP